MWLSTSDVYDITRTTVTEANVAEASADVMVYANRTPEASAGISPRDLYWIRQATAWQSVYHAGQTNVHARQAVRSVSQDGLSVQYSADWQIILSPLAARALKNLSWKASGFRRTRDVSEPLGNTGVVMFGLEESDSLHEWGEL